MTVLNLLEIDSSGQAAATCVVCGKEIPAGAGVTARFRGRTLRFKCPGCLSRFVVDPDHYLMAGPSPCCEAGEHGDGHASGAH